MDSISKINSKLKRCSENIKELYKSQEQLLEQINQAINEKDAHLLPLKATVRKLIEHGISKTEIHTITGISPEDYDHIVSEKKYYQLPYVYLIKGEVDTFDRLLNDIHNSKDIHELINPVKEGERIKFIQSVLVRFQQEANLLLAEKNEDTAEKMIKHLESAAKNEQAKRAYSSLVRIFGNEIKKKREDVLIQVSDD